MTELECSGMGRRGDMNVTLLLAGELQRNAKLNVTLNVTMTQKNQHKPRRKQLFFLWPKIHLIYIFIAPDEFIKGPLIDYYAMGINDIEITKLLKGHYDTTKYGLRQVLFLIQVYMSDQILVCTLFEG